MLEALIRVRLEALKSWFTGAGQRKKKSTKASSFGFAALMIVSLLSLGFMFWHYFDTLARPLHALALDWVFFALTGITCFSLMLIGTAFFAKAQLFEAKDNELLLSMPIAPRDILLSRLVMLLVIAVFFGLPVIVPAAVIGLRTIGADAYAVTAFAVLYLLLPVFAVAVSALMGWLFHVLSSRVKSKALWGTLFCFAAILAYSWLVVKINTSLVDVATLAGGISSQLRSAAPVYWFGAAIADGQRAYLALLAAIFIGSAAVCFALLSAGFVRTATTKRGFSQAAYREKAVRAASPDSALLRRELSRLTSSAGYMVNAGLGSFFLLIGAAALLIKGGEIRSLIDTVPELAVLLPPILIAGLTLLCSMCFISAPSVSLEGANLWIVRSLPVDTRQVLRAKLKLHWLVCLPPALIFAGAAIPVFRLAPADALLLICVPAVFTVFCGILGLWENLRHPMLDWMNETQAVKSGIGVLYTMLISWLVIAVPVLLIIAAGKVSLYRLAAAVFVPLCAIGAWALYRRCMTRGCELFEALQA